MIWQSHVWPAFSKSTLTQQVTNHIITAVIIIMPTTVHISLQSLQFTNILHCSHDHHTSVQQPITLQSWWSHTLQFTNISHCSHHCHTHCSSVTSHTAVMIITHTLQFTNISHCSHVHHTHYPSMTSHCSHDQLHTLQFINISHWSHDHPHTHYSLLTSHIALSIISYTTMNPSWRISPGQSISSTLHKPKHLLHVWPKVWIGWTGTQSKQKSRLPCCANQDSMESLKTRQPLFLSCSTLCSSCPCPTVQTTLDLVPLCRQLLSLSHCADSTWSCPTVQTALVPVPLCRQHLILSHCADSSCPCPTVQTALDLVPLCRQHLSLSHKAGSTCPCPIVQTAFVPVPLCRQHLTLSHCADSTCLCPLVGGITVWHRKHSKQCGVCQTMPSQFRRISCTVWFLLTFCISAFCKEEERRKEMSTKRTMPDAPHTGYFPILNWAEQITHLFSFFQGIGSLIFYYLNRDRLFIFPLTQQSAV